jgi:hypothetical protein
MDYAGPPNVGWGPDGKKNAPQQRKTGQKSLHQIGKTGCQLQSDYIRQI